MPEQSPSRRTAALTRACTMCPVTGNAATTWRRRWRWCASASKLALRRTPLPPPGRPVLFHGTVFPFMAYELGLDSVQIRTADPAGGSAGASEIVLTGHSGAGDECCRGCTARERALSCLAPLFTCGSVELRTGWQASRRCECDGRPVGLNCDLGCDCVLSRAEIRPKGVS